MKYILVSLLSCWHRTRSSVYNAQWRQIPSPHPQFFFSGAGWLLSRINLFPAPLSKFCKNIEERKMYTQLGIPPPPRPHSIELDAHRLGIWCEFMAAILNVCKTKSRFLVFTATYSKNLSQLSCSKWTVSLIEYVLFNNVARVAVTRIWSSARAGVLLRSLKSLGVCENRDAEEEGWQERFRPYRGANQHGQNNSGWLPTNLWLLF